MAGPCRFWAQGTCRNGDNCRFEHGPVNQGYQGGGGGRGANQGGYQSGNRYAPLQNQDQSRNNGGRQPAQPPPRAPPYQLEKAAIIVDLSSERPQWPLSAYGPGRSAPAQVFGGPVREQSFEEMRLKHYVAVAAGNPAVAVQEAEQMVQAAERQREEALHDVDAVIKYLIDGENSNPNRLDILRSTQDGTLQQNPFNSTPTQPSGAFGSQPPNPFVSPTSPASSTNPFGGSAGRSFGKSSALGAPTGAFGQPSVSGAPAGAFGQPSVLGAPSGAFGRPSVLGAPSGAFGQPSQNTGVFGAPSSTSASNAAPFSGFAQAPSAFGQTQPAAGAFGAPSQQAANPFGSVQPATSGFGAPSQTSTSNPFATESNSAFVTPSPRNPFGAPQPAVVATNPFQTTSSSLLGPNPAPSQANPFGAPSNNQVPRPDAFGQPTNPLRIVGAPVVNGTAARPYAPPKSTNPPIASYTSRDGAGNLMTFKGKRVVYKGKDPGTTGPDGKWHRICFPEGPPQFVKDAVAEEEVYDDETRQAFEQLRLTGSFPNNEVPLLPPSGEWVRWDF